MNFRTNNRFPERFLIVGLGSIGLRHLRNLRSLRPKAHIILLRRPDSKPLPPEYTGLADGCVFTLEAAIESKPQAAIVCNPAPSHLEVALPLFKAGCHLLIEKPLSHEFPAANTFKEVMVSENRCVMVGYCLRSDESLQVFKKNLDEGIIGKTLSARSEVGSYLPDWRPNVPYQQSVSAQKKLGGGALLELSHEIDYMLWLLGPVHQIGCLAQKSSGLDLDVEDTAELLLQFSSGTLASIGMNFVQRHNSRSCRLVGEKGTLFWDYTTSCVSFENGSNPPRLLFQNPTKDRNTMYLKQLESFLDGCCGIIPPLVSYQDGLNVLQVIDAAKRSSSTGSFQTL